jgi:hypothetical protein
MSSLARLPTDLGMTIIGDLVKSRLRETVHTKEAVTAFQRMALVSTLEDSIEAMNYWVKPEHKRWAKPEKDQLEVAHRLVRPDVLGLAIESLVQLATHGRSEKERLAASVILNELYGEKELVDTNSLTDKLLVNIVKGS